MLERIHYWTMYVGSAAVTAFLAACLSSPRIDSFTCPVAAGGAEGSDECELAATLAATVPEAGGMSPEILAAVRVEKDLNAAQSTTAR